MAEVCPLLRSQRDAVEGRVAEAALVQPEMEAAEGDREDGSPVRARPRAPVVQGDELGRGPARDAAVGFDTRVDPVAEILGPEGFVLGRVGLVGQDLAVGIDDVDTLVLFRPLLLDAAI